jgi:uncharacterized Zn-finger protein
MKISELLNPAEEQAAMEDVGDEPLEFPSLLGCVFLSVHGPNLLPRSMVPPAPPQARDSNRFFCPEPNCGKSFIRRQNLKSHIEQVHIDLRPFGCEHCGAAFKRPQELKRHQRTVHGGPESVIAVCSLCSREFRRKDAYVRHQQSCRTRQSR